MAAAQLSSLTPWDNPGTEKKSGGMAVTLKSNGKEMASERLSDEGRGTKVRSNNLAVDDTMLNCNR